MEGGDAGVAGVEVLQCWNGAVLHVRIPRRGVAGPLQRLSLHLSKCFPTSTDDPPRRVIYSRATSANCTPASTHQEEPGTPHQEPATHGKRHAERAGSQRPPRGQRGHHAVSGGEQVARGQHSQPHSNQHAHASLN